MQDNPYAPPSANVEDVRPAPPEVPVFFAVSLVKLTIMSFCTLGLYETYWFYRNWKIVQEREQSDIFPFWRAIFGVFFCYSMFRRVRDAGEEHGVHPVPPAGFLTALWIIFNITWRLPEWYGLIAFLSVFLLWPVQACINGINAVAAPNHDANWRLTSWNWFGIAAGVAFVILAVSGALDPEIVLELPAPESR